MGVQWAIMNEGGLNRMPNSIAPAKYSAEIVADYFILLSASKNVDENVSEGVTPLKLQKLLYFAQAASLVLHSTKIFNEDIQAWKYGPVVSSIYHKYKTNPNEPITIPSGDYSKVTDNQTKDIIEGIWELFGKYSAEELVEITHNHDPWQKIYKEGENRTIPVELLKEYYTGIFEFQSSDEK